MSIRFKCSPELADGDHWTVVDTPEQLVELVTEWAKYNKVNIGESFEVETVEMSDDEVAALPDL